MRNILVRVFNYEGKPVQSARVTINVYQFLAGGQKEQYTNSNGEAEFSMDIDDGAEISIGVNGNEKVGRGKVLGNYRLSL